MLEKVITRIILGRQQEEEVRDEALRRSEVNREDGEIEVEAAETRKTQINEDDDNVEVDNNINDQERLLTESSLI